MLSQHHREKVTKGDFPDPKVIWRRFEFSCPIATSIAFTLSSRQFILNYCYCPIHNKNYVHKIIIVFLHIVYYSINNSRNKIKLFRVLRQIYHEAAGCVNYYSFYIQWWLARNITIKNTFCIVNVCMSKLMKTEHNEARRHGKMI